MPYPPAGSAGLLLVLGSSVLYGLNVGYARLASFAGVSGSTLVAYRVLIMLVVAGSVALVLGRSLQVARDERGIVGLLGITTALVSIGYLSSVAYIPVAVAVVAALAAPFILGETLTPIQILGGTLVIAAIAANVILESRRRAVAAAG